MERNTLRALYHDGHPVRLETLRKAVGGTMRGHRQVRIRLMDAGLIEHAKYEGAPRVQLTEAGRRAVTLDEPCSICGGEIAESDGKDRGGDVTHDVCLENIGERA